MDNSIDVSLSVERREVIDYGHLTVGSGKNYTRSLLFDKINFFDETYQKYFSIMVILRRKPLNNHVSYGLYMMIRKEKQIIMAKVNRYDLYNADYGTKENPVPILMFFIPENEINKPSFPMSVKEYKELAITQEQYEDAVYFYLTYVMSKKEFKEAWVTK
ncbi:MAG: hypothetical protein LBT79_02540 [Elusimicrobiota bacterium]|jgi:hypothetical protein|nr:hypothetical protein [Elusimicrobiota bacterium]